MSKSPLNFPVESLLDQCAICLEKCKNKSFPKSCLHAFCFCCLIQWSQVKPQCPLCLKPFSSVIHNMKSNHDYDELDIHQGWPEEILSSEFSESAGEDSSWSSTSSTTSWYTVSSSSSTDHLLSEQPNSHTVEHMMQPGTNILTEPWREFSSEESSNDTRSESSWFTINTESDDYLSRLQEQGVLSERDLENLDTLLVIPSNSAVFNNDPSLLLEFQPTPNTIVRILLVPNEERDDGRPAEPFAIGESLFETVCRWLQDTAPSDEDNVNID